MNTLHQPSAVDAAREQFEHDGYHATRGLFTRGEAERAAAWLRAQDQASLAKSWTEQEPAVPLAVYSVVHQTLSPLAEMTRDRRILDTAAALVGSPVYVWSSKVNVKAAWCGTAEYYHQDLAYWKDRGYPKDEMLSCMVFLEPHTLANAALHVLPGTHRYGYIEHQPFININGLAKMMVPPDTLNELHRKHPVTVIEAQPGDALFFHTSLVHGSGHNISPNGRMILLAQLNTVGNEPHEVTANARLWNLKRAEIEMKEAERRYQWFRQKYEQQLAAEAPTFCPPVPEEERVKA
jgi:ectoine hydroxylase